jgi:hypothetical protein
MIERRLFIAAPSHRGRNIEYAPLAFTEHGAVMAASVPPVSARRRIGYL